MFRIKVGAMLVCIAVVLSACMGTGGAGKANKGRSADSDKKIKVALVFSGALGDEGFNDSAYAGLQQAKSIFNIEETVLEADEEADWEDNFLSVCTGEYDLIIAVSSQFTDIVEKHAPQFPDQKFALIDNVVKGKNILSSTFAQNEGSFLAGAAAAMFTTKTEIDGVNPEKIIGWVGGMDIPVMHDFLIGYEQGAKYIDPEIEILASYSDTFNEPEKGKVLAMEQFNKGADIVMNVAGNTGLGVLEAAKESGKYAIGVDLDQDASQPGHILTSMLKRVDTATFMAIQSVVDETFRGNTTTYLDIQNGGVGLTEMEVMKEALGDKFPQDILDTIQKLEKKVRAGELSVTAYEGFGKQ